MNILHGKFMLYSNISKYITIQLDYSTKNLPNQPIRMLSKKRSNAVMNMKPIKYDGREVVGRNHIPFYPTSRYEMPKMITEW